MASDTLSASRQQHWFSTAGHSSDLASVAPSLGPSQQAESKGAAALAHTGSPFCLHAHHAAVLGGPWD